MDTGRGHFESADSVEELEKKLRELNKKITPPDRGEPHIFSVGDEIEIHGSRFRVTKITYRTMKLLLLPRGNGQEARG